MGQNVLSVTAEVWTLA